MFTESISSLARSQPKWAAPGWLCVGSTGDRVTKSTPSSAAMTNSSASWQDAAKREAARRGGGTAPTPGEDPCRSGAPAANDASAAHPSSHLFRNCLPVKCHPTPQPITHPTSPAPASQSNATPTPAIPAAHPLSASSERPPLTQPAPPQPVLVTNCPTTASGAAAPNESQPPGNVADPQKAPVH